MKRTFYYLIKNRTFKKILLEIIKLFFSSLVGFMLGLALHDFRKFIAGLILLIITSIIVAIINKKDINSFDIVNVLKNEAEAGNWTDVVCLGYPLSRPLWNSGRYLLRIKIGEMVKDAISRIPNEIVIGDKHYNCNYIHASLLIDDLGWTRYMNHQLQKAESNIKAGISIAKENKDYDIALKGYRHLAGISVREDNDTLLQEVLNELDNLQPFVEGYNNIKEINANRDYTRAEIYLKKKDYDNALHMVKDVQEIYEALKDEGRLVKTLDLSGRIYLAKGDYQRAKIEFLKGMNSALNSGRKERYLRIAISYFELNSKIVEIDTNYLEEEYYRDKVEFEKIFVNVTKIAEEVQQEIRLKDLHRNYKYLKKAMKKRVKENK